jgi:hypothetical protein
MGAFARLVRESHPRPSGRGQRRAARDARTVAGFNVKPIEAIEVGDRVWAWDEAADSLVQRRVNRLFRRRSKPILKVICATDDGSQQIIEATTEHSFWIDGKGWVAACESQAGDAVKRIDAERRTRVLRVDAPGNTADVYNFEVDGHHNYFVGRANRLQAS